MDHLLKLAVSLESSVLLSYWRAIFHPQFLQLISIMSSISIIRLFLLLIQQLSGIEDTILIREGENYGLDVARPDAVYEVVDFLVVRVETVGKALNRKDGYVYSFSKAVAGFIDPATEDEANRLQIVIQILLYLPLRDNLDEAFAGISCVQF